MQDYQHAAAYVTALTNGINTVMDFRAIHETDRTVPAIIRRGTLFDLWNELIYWNNQGFGIYCIVAETDGIGRKLENVTALRAHYVDLDNADAQQQMQIAINSEPYPQFYVQSSPGKFHIYWSIEKHSDREKFTLVQRKLVSKFNSDPTIIDASRVLRLPGTLHMKNPASPSLVTFQALPAAHLRTSSDALDLIHWSVRPSDHGGGTSGARTPVGLGERAPSTTEALAMLQSIDVRQITDRNHWVAITGALIQSVNPDDLPMVFEVYQDWNKPYPGNDPNANAKVWNDILQNGTSVGGWSRLHKEGTGVTPQQLRLMPVLNMKPLQMSDAPAPQATPDAQGFGPILNAQECSQWFNNCFLISSENKILCPDNVFRDSSAFNSTYGGKLFIWDMTGKVTNEPWMAATRSQLWRVPQSQFTCFRPELETRAIVEDELKRRYVNIYLPAKIKSRKGDPKPFLDHLEKMLPDLRDRKIILDYLAHNAKYPGHKIFWAPLIQGAEGIGKNLIKAVMQNAIGGMYFYEPKAKQLNESGSKFNAWQEFKVFFIVDEIKTDENRDLVETLKPMISEKRMEIEGKGSNQRMGDTPGNWLFFSNWKDAIPITVDSRRYSIFYSALQSVADILNAGMNDDYFKYIYDWIDFQGGAEIVTDYLLHYPILRGSLPTRAPNTTSRAEALVESRGWVEQSIMSAVEANEAGFRSGWVSTSAVNRVFRNNGQRIPAAKTLSASLKALGFVHIGQAGKGYFNDDPQHADKRAHLWHKNPDKITTTYPADQGYFES